jgi:hypothetical protein
MSPDGKNWTITLRKSIQFNDNWGEFTAKDVRHAVFLLSQSESVQTDRCRHLANMDGHHQNSGDSRRLNACADHQARLCT